MQQKTVWICSLSLSLVRHGLLYMHREILSTNKIGSSRSNLRLKYFVVNNIVDDCFNSWKQLVLSSILFTFVPTTENNVFSAQHCSRLFQQYCWRLMNEQRWTALFWQHLSSMFHQPRWRLFHHVAITIVRSSGVDKLLEQCCLITTVVWTMLFTHDNNVVQALFKEQRRTTWSILRVI